MTLTVENPPLERCAMLPGHEIVGGNAELTEIVNVQDEDLLALSIAVHLT